VYGGGLDRTYVGATPTPTAEQFGSTPNPFLIMKLFDKIKSDPRVEDVWNEGPSWDDGQCWWVSLRYGFEWEGCSTIHERTLTNVLKALKQVIKVN